MSKKEANILLIGCGLHAQRVYLPAFKNAEKEFDVKISVLVDLEHKREEISPIALRVFPNIEELYIKPFPDGVTHVLPDDLQDQLSNLVLKHHINAVVIATDPLHHMQYTLWAQKMGLHILMDKPISTYENVANSIVQAKQLKKDFTLLIKNYSEELAFIINAQRRFLPQFKIIQKLINGVASNYGVPISSIQSSHSDGQWRLPNEVLEIKYHPLLGWGKVSHSGYHFIDMAGTLIKNSFSAAAKRFDAVSVFSKFIRPQGVLKILSQEDLRKIFGEEYQEYSPMNDEMLTKLYKQKNEAEVDASSIINFSSEGIPVTNMILNLVHNGFSKRSWLLPNKDLYKGNGRLRHEYHNIQQGPLQNIQIHSYQSKDKHDINTEDDFEIGGNNHYDIHIYRNNGIIGGKAFEIITAKDIAIEYNLDRTKVMNELARHAAVKEFLEVVVGKRKGIETRANLLDHYLSVQLMSMIYASAIKKKEITQKVCFPARCVSHHKSKGLKFQHQQKEKR